MEFAAVSKYYANKDYPLSAYFKQESKKIFNSTGENLDFDLADEAAKIINKWVCIIFLTDDRENNAVVEEKEEINYDRTQLK